MNVFVSVPGRRRPRIRWVTPLIVALSMAGFVWLATMNPDAQAAFLLRWGAVPRSLFSPALLSDALLDGRAFSLVSALFLHVNWLHLLGNLLFLLIFGLPAERSLGPLRFLVLFVFCGVAANLSAAWSLDGTGAVIIGSSGAVSGLIGAFLVLFPRAQLAIVLPLGLFLEFVRTPASVLIGIWALLQLMFAYVGPTFGAVAWWAHLAGFALGMLLAIPMRRGVARQLRRNR
jgi:membrane associated rhomboid family serine protease